MGKDRAFPLPVLVINLLSRPDKWEMMRTKLEPFGIEPIRSPGVDVTANPALVTQSSRYVVGTGAYPGAAGVALAHMAAWQTVIANDTSMLILEDDAALPLFRDETEVAERLADLFNAGVRAGQSEFGEYSINN